MRSAAASVVCIFWFTPSLSFGFVRELISPAGGRGWGIDRNNSGQKNENELPRGGRRGHKHFLATDGHGFCNFWATVSIHKAITSLVRGAFVCLTEACSGEHLQMCG